MHTNYTTNIHIKLLQRVYLRVNNFPFILQIPKDYAFYHQSRRFLVEENFNNYLLNNYYLYSCETLIISSSKQPYDLGFDK